MLMASGSSRSSARLCALAACAGGVLEEVLQAAGAAPPPLVRPGRHAAWHARSWWRAPPSPSAAAASAAVLHPSSHAAVVLPHSEGGVGDPVVAACCVGQRPISVSPCSRSRISVGAPSRAVHTRGGPCYRCTSRREPEGEEAVGGAPPLPPRAHFVHAREGFPLIQLLCRRTTRRCSGDALAAPLRCCRCHRITAVCRARAPRGCSSAPPHRGDASGALIHRGGGRTCASSIYSSAGGGGWGRGAEWRRWRGDFASRNRATAG